MVAQMDSVYVRHRPSRVWSRLVSYAFYEGRPLTTRGRWFNPIVFALLGLQKRLPGSQRLRKPVFILGTGRSGTTILGVVLSMHSEVGFLNEPKAIWASLSRNEDLIGSYHRIPARYRLDASDADQELIQRAHRVYSGYLAATRNTRVVEKYPEMIFRLPFIRAIFPDAKFLFLSRNGGDTCASISEWSLVHKAENAREVHDWWGANKRKWKFLLEQIVPEHDDLRMHLSDISELSDQVSMAAIEWIVTMREGIKLVKSGDQDVMLVSYEKLCSEPKMTCNGILDFLELPHDDTMLDFAARVLKPTSRGKELELPPYIENAFKRTSKELNEVIV